jgi:hypothetical protein
MDQDQPATLLRHHLEFPEIRVPTFEAVIQVDQQRQPAGVSAWGLLRCLQQELRLVE